MEWALVLTGLALLGFAGYSASDPMSRARNWVDGAEWERDPEAAKRKQVRYTYGMSAVVAAFGVFFLVAGFVA
jgi:hypothetical protein